jgi:hypothetical protein
VSFQRDPAGKEKRSSASVAVNALAAGLLLFPLSAGVGWQQAPPPSTPAQSASAEPPPPTEIFLATLAPETDDSLRVGTPENISKNSGYDNQPAFLPGGGSLLFTSSRDGKQTDIYRYDLASKAMEQLTRTTESEYSPTVTPAGDRFSVIRVEADGTQRLWQFPLSVGSNATLILRDVKPVGYHVWADAETLVLFVLGEPPTLQVADVSTGGARTVAERPGRCLARTPAGKISYVQKGPAKEPWQIVEFEPKTNAKTPIAETLRDREDYAWLPDGRLLMASGPKIFLWDRNYRIQEWREIADLSTSRIRNITRLAVSPDAKLVAIVGEVETGF